MVAGREISRPEAAAVDSLQAPSEEQELGGLASPSSRAVDDLLDVSPYVELVTKVMEGLRGDAYGKEFGLGRSDGHSTPHRTGRAGGTNQGACVFFEST